MVVYRAAVVAVLLSASTALAQPQSIATEVFEKNSPAIVTIRTPSGLGSGVIIDPTGVIATNLHVVGGDSEAVIALSNGDEYDDIAVIDADSRRDLVLLKIQGFRLPSAVMGDSDSLTVGQEVYAIGAPQGLSLTISDGIISGIRPSGDGHRVVQTTVAISPGSSGGGLFNREGHLMGITAFVIEGGESLNFAIPINYVRGMFATEPRLSLGDLVQEQDEEESKNTGTSTSTSDVEDDLSGLWSYSSALRRVGGGGGAALRASSPSTRLRRAP